MNFLIDANLPRRLTRIFQERGHSAVHTLDLPEGNATADAALGKGLLKALMEERRKERLL